VLVNVVAAITTHSELSTHQMFNERELVKAKGIEDWQQEKHLWDSFIEFAKEL
jgi:hypothetical protein